MNNTIFINLPITLKNLINFYYKMLKPDLEFLYIKGNTKFQDVAFP